MNNNQKEAWGYWPLCWNNSHTNTNIFLGTKMARKPKMLNTLVTDNETKRIISFQKGGEVKEFRHLFLEALLDVILDKVAPANFKFQRYADNFEECVDVNNNERLDEDELKLLALVSKREKQVNVHSPLEGGWGTSVWNWAWLALVNSPPSPPKITILGMAQALFKYKKNSF